MNKTRVEPDDALEDVRRLTPRAARALMESMELNHGDVRAAVKQYYQLQDIRKMAANQARSSEGGNPLAEYMVEQAGVVERSIRHFLHAWVADDPVGRWQLRQVGIGPVLAAGTLAHIDVNRAATAGAVWRFAGLDPTSVWGRGKRRPWNADLKVVCWKIGDSFKKNHNRDGCFYGRLYVERKRYEVERDESGGNAATARETLETRDIRDVATRRCYEAGRLPPGRLDLRAMRWATKIYLSHLHEVMYREYLGKEPPKPFAVELLGHAHYIAPPE